MGNTDSISSGTADGGQGREETGQPAGSRGEESGQVLFSFGMSEETIANPFGSVPAGGSERGDLFGVSSGSGGARDGGEQPLFSFAVNSKPMEESNNNKGEPGKVPTNKRRRRRVNRRRREPGSFSSASTRTPSSLGSPRTSDITSIFGNARFGTGAFRRGSITRHDQSPGSTQQKSESAVAETAEREAHAPVETAGEIPSFDPTEDREPSEVEGPTAASVVPQCMPTEPVTKGQAERTLKIMKPHLRRQMSDEGIAILTNALSSPYSSNEFVNIDVAMDHLSKARTKYAVKVALQEVLGASLRYAKNQHGYTRADVLKRVRPIRTALGGDWDSGLRTQLHDVLNALPSDKEDINEPKILELLRESSAEAKDSGYRLPGAVAASPDIRVGTPLGWKGFKVMSIAYNISDEFNESVSAEEMRLVSPGV